MPRAFIPHQVPPGDGVLPQDLTAAEAGRLCEVIRALALPAEEGMPAGGLETRP